MYLAGGIDNALTTFAGLGLALILEHSGADKVRLGWTDAVEPRLSIEAKGYDAEEIAEVVHRHAQECASPDTWVQCDLAPPPWNGNSALLSPRVKAPSDSVGWRHLQGERHRVIDELMLSGRNEASLELIGALGEPSYWRVVNGDVRPDEGASRWEMKTRNRGEDFVGNRLRSLARLVSSRDASVVRSGLEGVAVIDEAYKGKRSSDSRTATGLARPSFTDSAVAWCGLWGIALFPVIPGRNRCSVTGGALPLGRFRSETLVLPALVGSCSLGRWRAILASEQLVRAASDDRTARAWLLRHGVRALVTHRVHYIGSPNAPERYLGEGKVQPLS